MRRADRSGFKAGALAAGLALSDAPYVAVFDADFVPPPDWLQRAMAAMLADPKAAFVQTRIEWGNGERNWLTRAQRLMQDAHFAVEQDVRARRGVPFQFNGTGGIWRRAAVEEAGGWSHDTLSEDLDLVLRTHLKGWRGVFLMEPHVVGELPQQARRFQRPAEPLVEGLRAGGAQAAADRSGIPTGRARPSSRPPWRSASSSSFRCWPWASWR